MICEHDVFKIHIVLKSGTLSVCKQNTFRCSISVTIFSVLIWDTFFFFCSVAIELFITIVIPKTYEYQTGFTDKREIATVEDIILIIMAYETTLFIRLMDFLYK